MKKYRDLYKRRKVNKLEKKRRILKFIMSSQYFSESIKFLASFELTKMKTQFKNRCILTGRGRFIFKKYKLSRISFKNLVHKIKGFRPSSW